MWSLKTGPFRGGRSVRARGRKRAKKQDGFMEFLVWHAHSFKSTCFSAPTTYMFSTINGTRRVWSTQRIRTAQHRVDWRRPLGRGAGFGSWRPWRGCPTSPTARSGTLKRRPTTRPRLNASFRVSRWGVRRWETGGGVFGCRVRVEERKETFFEELWVLDM